MVKARAASDVACLDARGSVRVVDVAFRHMCLTAGRARSTSMSSLKQTIQPT